MDRLGDAKVGSSLLCATLFNISAGLLPWEGHADDVTLELMRRSVGVLARCGLVGIGLGGSNRQTRRGGPHHGQPWGGWIWLTLTESGRLWIAACRQAGSGVLDWVK